MVLNAIWINISVGVGNHHAHCEISVWCVLFLAPMYTRSVLSFPLHAVDMLVCPSTKITASNMPWHLVQTQLVGVWIRPAILRWTAQLLSACTPCPRNAGITFTGIPEGICILLLALFWLQNAKDRLWGHCHRNITASTGQLHMAAYMSSRKTTWVSCACRQSSDSVKKGTWEQNRDCSPTPLMWGNNHAQHSPHASQGNVQAWGWTGHVRECAHWGRPWGWGDGKKGTVRQRK